MSKKYIKNKYIQFIVNKINLFIAFLILFLIIQPISIFAENLNISLNYGINNIAKKGMELPVSITVDNKDSQDFIGSLSLNIYENNNSVYIYRDDLNIGAGSSQILNFDVSISNRLSTITIDVYNRREEIVSTERINIDLSYYSNKLIIGMLTNDYEKYSYIDNILIEDTNIETKIVEVKKNYFSNYIKQLNLIDMLIITDFNYMTLSENELYNLKTFAESGKIVFISQYNNKTNLLPDFINEVYNNKRDLTFRNFEDTISFINTNNMNLFVSPASLTVSPNQTENVNFIRNFLNNATIKNIYSRHIEVNENIIENDYYNIGNLLNIVDKEKLPDIFILSIAIVIYVLILIFGIYVFLRNINKRSLYGKYAVIFSSITFIFLLIFVFRLTEKAAKLTYISIVDINDTSTSEKAFLNFRINDNKNLNFSISNNLSIYPLLKLTKDPIRSFNFLDFNNIKKTTFEDEDNRIYISVENADSLDPSIFVYKNDNYLNDVYNIACSYERFDGNVIGRITNNMGVTIRNAHILMQGKVLDIGDIEPNHSISLSRARVIGAPIGNNEMLADMLTDSTNHNIVKYYLDENIESKYDYALLFGFIDSNATLDINSNDVGNIYGKTLIVTKIYDGKIEGIDDLSGISNDVETLIGYYDKNNNSISGDEQVINMYKFDEKALITKIYLEPIESYDYGKLESNVPFYGDIYVYNYKTNQYDALNENIILYDELNKYLSEKNEVIFMYNPLSRDPLYRMISLPIPRAIASN